MKLHYSKILLFSLSLNILVASSSDAHNKNKPYITPNTPTTTLRVLSECDLYMPNYDKDADMKSVKEIFDRQTSQRFEEYEERVQDKRKKCKEQCDKDIQEIIVKDKVQKSLAKKVEQGCLKCGCGLGGGVLPVWSLVSGLWYATWSQYVATTVAEAATDAGIKAAVKGLGNICGLKDFNFIEWIPKINGSNFLNPNSLLSIVNEVNNMCTESSSAFHSSFCTASYSYSRKGTSAAFTKLISQGAAKVAEEAGKAAKAAELVESAKYTSTTSIYSTSIIASIVAIVVIVLVMIIIYLILHYRRKKRKNKKLQYTKLLKD
ncbi:hypothetical protein PFTANZ_01668 [Plasmodium falciparum Tanzania (2000708)]|uniref:Surface antigen n=1 Tax=Plasmodium falciparum Tanzania (2000708) TaxID=1036725 RepID=A0A024W9P4_PLAFA|nr:hypothetical protein PFTANZ_01668 [Plasmodium falciparum Tanzania (2000708)]